MKVFACVCIFAYFLFVYLFFLFLYICLFCVCIFAYFRFVYLFILYLYICLIVLVYLPILYLYFCCCSFVFLLSVLVSWQQYQRWKHFRAEHYLPSMPATAILPIQLPGHHVAVFCILYFVFALNASNRNPPHTSPRPPRCCIFHRICVYFDVIFFIQHPGHHVTVFPLYLCLFQCNFFLPQSFRYNV